MKHLPLISIGIFIAALLLLTGTAGAATPIAAFSATPTSGIVSLHVMFTDASTGFLPGSGRAWFFGDETYTQPWTQMIATAGWSARDGHTSVTMPDGSIVLMGGWGSGLLKNDVWRSTDNGATWTQVNASAGWSARYLHTSVVIPNGSIVLMGGDDGGLKNDVWRSTDNGATWTQLPGAGWSGRESHTSVTMPDGSIVLMGGRDGGLKNDVWRSTDNGATWTQLPGAGWSGRESHTSVTMPDGSIVLMGGRDGGLKNDVWRFSPVGSSLQNPSHTYTVAGTYPVVLQAYDAEVYNSTRKTSYITVTAVPAVTIPPDPNPPSTVPNGGSDGGPAPDQAPGQPATTDVNVGGDSAVTQVVVTGTGISDLIVTGRVVSGPGNGVSSPPGLVYEFVEISPARYGTITGAQIFFTVPQSWLDANQLTPQHVVLEHNVGSGWEPLTTTPLRSENGQAEFYGTSQGFSRFAITGQPGISPVTMVTTSLETEQTFGDLQPAPGAGSPLPAAPPVASEPVVAQTTAIPDPQPAPVFPVAALVFIAGIVLAGSGFLVRRWWIRRQNPALFRNYD